jgi:hypothetical protein
VLDNRRRKAVAAIRKKSHGERLSYPPLALTPVSVTRPRRRAPPRPPRIPGSVTSTLHRGVIPILLLQGFGTKWALWKPVG